MITVGAGLTLSAWPAGFAGGLVVAPADCDGCALLVALTGLRGAPVAVGAGDRPAADGGVDRDPDGSRASR
jgi:hypothetical protein